MYMLSLNISMYILYMGRTMPAVTKLSGDNDKQKRAGRGRVLRKPAVFQLTTFLHVCFTFSSTGLPHAHKHTLTADMLAAKSSRRKRHAWKAEGRRREARLACPYWGTAANQIELVGWGKVGTTVDARLPHLHASELSAQLWVYSHYRPARL
jgi:hypothetical protein